MATPFPEFRRIERLRVRNYRALKDVTFENLAPLTVLLGPNGSGKSTVFDAIEFLREAVTLGLPAALGRRGGIAELRTRGAAGPVSIELAYWDMCREETLVYRIEVDEEGGDAVVVSETLGSADGDAAIEFTRGGGWVSADVTHEGEPADARERIELRNPGVLALSVFGQLAQYRRAVSLVQFIGQLRTGFFGIGDPLTRSGRPR